MARSEVLWWIADRIWRRSSTESRETTDLEIPTQVETDNCYLLITPFSEEHLIRSIVVFQVGIIFDAK